MALEDGSRPYYVIADILGGGMGGAPGADGLNAVDSHGGNCALLSAEVMETLSPIRVLRTELVPGSGGKGQYRGGLGIERDYEILSGVSIVSGYNQQTRTDTAPWGYAGGLSGATAALIQNPGTQTRSISKVKLSGCGFRVVMSCVFVVRVVVVGVTLLNGIPTQWRKIAEKVTFDLLEATIKSAHHRQ